MLLWTSVNLALCDVHWLGLGALQWLHLLCHVFLHCWQSAAMRRRRACDINPATAGWIFSLNASVPFVTLEWVVVLCDLCLVSSCFVLGVHLWWGLVVSEQQLWILSQAALDFACLLFCPVALHVFLTHFLQHVLQLKEKKRKTLAHKHVWTSQCVLVKKGNNCRLRDDNDGHGVKELNFSEWNEVLRVSSSDLASVGCPWKKHDKCMLVHSLDHQHTQTWNIHTQRSPKQFSLSWCKTDNHFNNHDTPNQIKWQLFNTSNTD